METEISELIEDHDDGMPDVHRFHTGITGCGSYYTAGHRRKAADIKRLKALERKIYTPIHGDDDV